MGTKLMDLGNAQEAFYSALKSSSDMVTNMRRSRAYGTQELPALEMDQATKKATLPENQTPKNPPSKIRVSIPKANQRYPTTEFDATMTLVKRLSTLGAKEEQGEIVCISEELKFDPRNRGFSCVGIQSFWTRSGKAAPPIVYSTEPLEDVTVRSPIAIFMDPEAAPQEVHGYIRATLTDPHVCMFLREG